MYEHLHWTACWARRRRRRCRRRHEHAPPRLCADRFLLLIYFMLYILLVCLSSSIWRVWLGDWTICEIFFSSIFVVVVCAPQSKIFCVFAADRKRQPGHKSMQNKSTLGSPASQRNSFINHLRFGRPILNIELDDWKIVGTRGVGYFWTNRKNGNEKRNSKILSFCFFFRIFKCVQLRNAKRALHMHLTAQNQMVDAKFRRFCFLCSTSFVKTIMAWIISVLDFFTLLAHPIDYPPPAPLSRSLHFSRQRAQIIAIIIIRKNRSRINSHVWIVCFLDLSVSGFSIWIYASASNWCCVDICCCVKITECDNMPSIIIIHRLAKHLSSPSLGGVTWTSHVSVAHRFFERCRKCPFMKIRHRAVFAVPLTMSTHRCRWCVDGPIRVTCSDRDFKRLAFAKHNRRRCRVVGIQITWEIKAKNIHT